MGGAMDDLNRLEWRTMDAADEVALQELDRACKAVDGEEPVSHLAKDALRAAANHSDDTLGVALGSQLAAAAWVIPDEPLQNQAQTIHLGGRVRPEFRQHGIGEALLAWAENRALRLTRSEITLQLRIANEALTEDANQLYLDYGYEPVFSEYMLERGLDDAGEPVALPPGMSEKAWQDEETARDFFQAYRESFRDRLGEIVPIGADWIREYTGDDQFRPDLSRVVLEGNIPVGFITCAVDGNTGWISQIGVVPDKRRKGLALVLLQGALKRLKQSGCSETVLHVNANNAAAQAVFYGAGFTHRLTRARFLKEIAVGAKIE